MTSIERTAYPRFTRAPSVKELASKCYSDEKLQHLCEGALQAV
jgi:hypothetical protein